MSLQTTIQPIANGLDTIAGRGEDQTISFTGTWATGDTFSLTFTDQLTALQTLVGAGNATGISPAFVMTFDQKLNLLSGSDWFFSAVDDPTKFNDLTNDQNGFIETGNFWGTPEDLVAMAPFQGNVALIARRTVQIWSTDPAAAKYAIQQVLPNIGTVSGASVQAVGDMDVYMLADSGVRSLRVRVASNNAQVVDVGSPIDLILQPLLAALTDAEKAASCSITEPSANRYMLFVPDTANANGVGLIYVFSSFPSSQIEAWSTYEPSYQVVATKPVGDYPGPGNPTQLTYTGLVVGKRYAWTPGANEVSLTNGSAVLTKAGSFVAAATTAVVVGAAPSDAFTGNLTVTTYFTPQRFVVFDGQVYVRDTANNVYQLGGSTNLVYENCGVAAVTPYHDEGTPGHLKSFEAIEAGFEGTWGISFSSDYTTGKFKAVYANSVSTFQIGRVPVKMKGTHYALQFVEDSNGYARFSSALVHTQKAEEK